MKATLSIKILCIFIYWCTQIAAQILTTPTESPVGNCDLLNNNCTFWQRDESKWPVRKDALSDGTVITFLEAYDMDSGQIVSETFRTGNDKTACLHFTYSIQTDGNHHGEYLELYWRRTGRVVDKRTVQFWQSQGRYNDGKWRSETLRIVADYNIQVIFKVSNINRYISVGLMNMQIYAEPCAPVDGGIFAPPAIFSNVRGARSFRTFQINLWDRGEIPYEIGPFDDDRRDEILQALENIHFHVPCIRFIRRTNQNEYLNFQPAMSGCSGGLGRNLGDATKILLMPSDICFNNGALYKRIFYAIGVKSEHVSF